MNRQILFASLVVGLLAASARAQMPCYAENDDASFFDGSSMGGPNLLVGIRVDVTQSIVVSRIEVFTGEQIGVNSLAVWSHDAALNQPAASLGSGSFAMSSTNSWQGADLATPVAMNAGATYWIVWGPQNGAQSSLLPAQAVVGQVYRGSFNGGATWTGPFQFTTSHWKFRLFCSCSGFFQEYGTGCVGSAGVPEMDGSGCPSPGDTVLISIEQGPPSATVLLGVGGGNASLPLSPTCMLQNLPLLLAPSVFNLGPAGNITLFGPLPPNSPTIDFYLQAILVDAGVSAGFSSTRPLRMHVQ